MGSLVPDKSPPPGPLKNGSGGGFLTASHKAGFYHGAFFIASKKFTYFSLVISAIHPLVLASDSYFFNQPHTIQRKRC